MDERTPTGAKQKDNREWPSHTMDRVMALRSCHHTTPLNPLSNTLPSRTFYERVYAVVRTIPRGRVSTYGHVAALLGSPRSARTVGFALRALPVQTTVPWHRVVNHEGRLSIINPHVPAALQATLLRKEGVEVVEESGEYTVALEQCLWYVNLRVQ